MKLTDFFPGKTNIDSTVQTTRPQGSAAVEQSRPQQALVPGQTIHGEVVGRNGSEVQVRLAPDMVLNARVDQGIYLEMGKMLTFEVKNSGAALMLSPLFTNVATDGNILKALNMAGLPVNDRSVEMTKQLMDGGLPVNKAMLQQVYRELHMLQEASVEDVVNLHRLQLPVTAENVGQMASYRNLTYQLSAAADTILENLPQAVGSMVEAGRFSEAAELYRQLFAMLREALGGDAEAAAGQTEELMQRAAAAENASIPGGELTSSAEAEAAGETDFPSGVPGADTSVQHKAAGELLRLLNDMQLPEEQNELFAQQLKLAAQGQDTAALTELAERLLTQALESGKEKAAGKALVDMPELGKLLSQQLKESWSIRPEETASPEKVRELYSRITRQLEGLSKALEAGGQTESGAYKAVSSMAQNVDFLQQLNQMYAYVQLPVRMQQGTAHGDLYVYANRKGLASASGQVSALLHLDMQYLGPLDVYVTLQNAKVGTKFYVQDEALLDFLADHMELLTQRRKKRDYDCDCSMTVREKGGAKENAGDKGLEPFLGKEKGLSMAHYAFDVRT